MLTVRGGPLAITSHRRRFRLLWLYDTHFYCCGDDGAWTLTTLYVGAVDLGDLGGSIALDEIYLPDET